MDILGSIPLVGPVLVQVLTFVVGLSIIVAIHELGHLMVGRWCGIKAKVFSVGFGKVLWSRTDRHGTRWQVAVVPLGGFVKFLGDMDPASAGRADENEIPPEERRHAFHNAGLVARTLTVLAGPVANFLLAIGLFFGIALTGYMASDEPVVGNIDMTHAEEISGLQVDDRVLEVDGVPTATFGEMLRALSDSNGRVAPALVERDGERLTIDVRYVSPPVVTSIQIGGAGFDAGLRPGDVLLSVKGEPVGSAREVQRLITDLAAGAPAGIVVRRSGEEVEVTVVPNLVERPDPETGELRPIPFVGINMHDTGIEPLLVPASVSESAYFAVWRLWRIVSDTMLYLKEIVFGSADASELAGPIGIAKVLSTAADQGISDYLGVIAFLSAAIGFFNLLPIPVLDGGHLMFYLAEAIRGRPNNETVVRYGTMAGLSLLLLLMVYVTFNNDLGLGAWFAGL
jgi:regulator of sigma E protease